MIEYPGLKKKLKICDEPRKPRLEECQDGLMEAIVQLATHGSGADARRRTEKMRTIKTLDEMTAELNSMGYILSRSALYERLLPKNSRTIQGKRHVITVPVKLIKAQNDQHHRHMDTEFCTASIKALEEVTALLGKEEVTFLSQDAKARVPIGITAANKQAPLVMHLEYQVRLPDHDFVKAPRHKLIPDVYAGIDLKASRSDIGNPKSVGYSGPTFIAIRSAKHSESSAYSHLEDLYTLSTLPEFKDIMLTSDGVHKPVRVIICDGGPDENPRYSKTIECAIEQFQEHNLDALFIATNAPGRSAFNRVERRMAPLSRELSGVLLKHDQFGSHLDSQGRTIDEKLEADNFEHAGMTLADLWSSMVIDEYPVKAEYIKSAQHAEPEKHSQEWQNIHVRESQYMLQIVKCKNIECCSAERSSYFLFNEDRFLPGPLPLRQTKDNGVMVSIKDPMAKYPSMFVRKAMTKAILPRSAAKYPSGLPYDFACPSLQDKLPSRTCKNCGLYFASIKSLKSHNRTCTDRGEKGKSERSVSQYIRPVRVAARRQRELMCIVSYLESEDIEWHDEDDVQFDGNIPERDVISGTPMMPIDGLEAPWADA